jgi:acid phosphatase type 7
LLTLSVLTIFLSLLIYTTSREETTSTDAAILVGAGDISSCDNDNDEATAKLLDAIPGTVFVLGDDVYIDGTYRDFTDCYHPTWGRHKDRTRPVPGNHEYFTPSAAGYFTYFSSIPAYYAYDLEANPRLCALAYWHKPLWSSRYEDGSDARFETLWQILHDTGAELVVNGHIHNYERFKEMNAEGAAASPACVRLWLAQAV